MPNTSIKKFDGYTAVFRQWRAYGTHCKFLHGYSLSFEVTFAGELDERNWVWDFGGMKRSTGSIDGKNPKDWLDWLLDHTTIIAADDPELETFKQLEAKGIIQLRILPHTGAERFAEYLYMRLNDFVSAETAGRVRVSQVRFFENEKNSATYTED